MATVTRLPQIFLPFLLVALVTSSCALMPKTPKQTMAATYVAIETLAESTWVAFESGQIDRETTTRVYGRLKEAKAYVDAAAQLEGAESETRLEKARGLLTGVEAILTGVANE